MLLDGLKVLRTEGRTDGQTEGRTDRRTGGRKSGRTDGRTKGRTRTVCRSRFTRDDVLPISAKIGSSDTENKATSFRPFVRVSVRASVRPSECPCSDDSS